MARVEKLKPSDNDGGMWNGAVALESSLAVPQKVEPRVIIYMIQQFHL